MGKQKANDEQREEMKTLFTRGMLACEEIGERYGLSRQGVAQILGKMGVDTSKRKVVIPCTQCGTPTEKTRAEYRKHDQHFCSRKCYSDFLKRQDVQDEVQRQRVLRDKCSAYIPVDAIFAAFYEHEPSKDIFVFKDKESLLEWRRTGLWQDVGSMKNGGLVRVRMTPGGGVVFSDEKRSR